MITSIPFIWITILFILIILYIYPNLSFPAISPLNSSITFRSLSGCFTRVILVTVGTNAILCVMSATPGNNSIDVYVLDRKGTSGRHALIDRSEYWRDPRDGLRRWISEGRSLFLPPHEIWPFNMLGRYLCTRGIAPDVGIRRDRDRFRRQ